MISWLESHMLPCAYKSLLGIDCPVCGAQRSLVLLLKGDFKDSFFMYPPLIPALFAVIIWIACYIRPGNAYRQFARRYTWLLLGLVLMNYLAHFFI